MSFNTGLSGLNAASRNLDVIGNNIANANTTGMKASRAEFADVIASSIGLGGSNQAGLGVTVQTVSQQFSQGNITITGNNMDLAINGNGFFQLLMPDGTAAYTRAGDFKLSNTGFIMTNGGAKVLGYQTNINGVASNVTAGPLQLPTNAPIAANATTNILAELNLDARVGYTTSVGGVTAGFTTAPVTAFDYSTVLGSPASYTTAGIGSFDYSTIPGTPATYTTAPLGTVFYGIAGTPQVDGSSSVVTHSASTDFSQPFVAQVDATATSAAPLTAFDFSGANLGQFDVSFDGGATIAANITLTANYGSLAGVATEIQNQIRTQTGNAGFTVTLNGSNNLVYTNTGSTNAISILNSDANANTAGIANLSGAPGSAAIPTAAVSFLVDGIAVNLNGNYLASAPLETQALATAITSQLPGYTATINEGSNTIQLTKTGSLAPVVISANTLASAQEQTNAINAGFVASSGIAGTPAGSITPADVTITPPGGTPFAISLSGSLDAAGVLAAIQGTAGYATAGFTASVDGFGDLVLTNSNNTVGNFAVSLVNPLAPDDQTASGLITGSTPVAGVAANTGPNASFSIMPPGGAAFNVTLASNITGAADLAAAIQATAGYAVAGFTVSATNGNNPGSTLVFTAGNNTAADFTIGGPDAALITTGAAAVTGVADNTAPNATFDVVGPGGTAMTVNLTSNITGAADLAAAIQGSAGYAASGFTVVASPNDNNPGSTLVFTATSPNTAGDILITNPTADPESATLIAALGGAGSTATTGVTPTVTGTVIPRSTYGTALTAYDSQGVALPVSLYFTKVQPTTPGTDEWAVYDSLTGPSVGSLVFDATGKLTSSTVGTVTLTPAPPSIVTPFPVTVDFSKVTQYGTAFAVTNLTQDGYPPGTITDIKIGENGVITARYSNGQTQAAGMIALADFRNVQGLSPIGGNNWVETSASGQAIQGQPGQGKFGATRSGALEESNVDLTAELVNMMTAQRAYQANAQTIKTQDQVMSTLVNLR